MNKTDVKFKEIRVLIGKDLGQEIDNFLREDIELVGLQVVREVNEKVAYITYVDRATIAKKYEETGRKFEEYMYGNYNHAIEISVQKTGNLAEKMNEVFAENSDMEKMNEYYFLGANTRNVIILYASRSEVEANEEAARLAQQKLAEKLAGVKADELAENGVKEPSFDNQSIEVVEKYSTMNKEEETQENEEPDILETADIPESSESSEINTEAENVVTTTDIPDEKNVEKTKGLRSRIRKNK